MKAREKYRRFFRKPIQPIQPNICVLKKVEFEEWEVGSGKWEVDNKKLGVSHDYLLHDLHLFEEADNFGALLRPEMSEEQIANLRDYFANLWAKNPNPSLFEHKTHEKVTNILNQADFLTTKYHIVVANPPYMGSKGMNARLSAWAKKNYPNSKSDLFAMFIERGLELVIKCGYSAMITMQSWMFLSSYEKLRTKILNERTILSMTHLGARAFDSIGGEVVQSTAFILESSHHLEYQGQYLRLIDGNSETEKAQALKKAIKNPNCGCFYRASASDFKKIPGCAIAYWVSDRVRDSFIQGILIRDMADVSEGIKTGNNEKFLRFWYEVSGEKRYNNDPTKEVNKKWFLYHKGGDSRRWYGNIEFVIDWENDGYRIKNSSNSGLQGKKNYFNSGITWSKISSTYFGVRYLPENILFDSGSPSVFVKDPSLLKPLLGFLSSKVTTLILGATNPTLNFQVGNISSLPYLAITNIETANTVINKIISITKYDWNSYETSCNFTNLTLLSDPKKEKLTTYPLPTLLAETYNKLHQHWQEMISEMQKLEEENNRIFIEAYGLQDELTPDVLPKEITLTCNPHYRYNRDKHQEELENLLLADTIKEFISYSVGCMFGRYSLNKKGLILANQGETLQDYLIKVKSEQSEMGSNDKRESQTENNLYFLPTETNVIPILDGDWFSDDITEQFRQFLRVTFGYENYQDNLNFIEEAINKDIQKYFLKDFYHDHVKRYKKRPIYWLFSSPKGTFNALIYLHRYRPNTVSIVLNKYLREYRTKLQARLETLKQIEISSSASKTEKTKALRETEQIKKMLRELEDYEQETLYPLAVEKKEIDLDDGVKVNYKQFGKALKKVTGLS